MNIAKNLVRSIIRSTGFDIVRYTKQDKILSSQLKDHDIDIVFDIGAFSGYYAISLIKSGFQGRIISVEPMANYHCMISKLADNYDQWHVHERCAIYNYDGEGLLNISGNVQSSSLLNMLKTHMNALPLSKYVGTEKVPVQTLDEMAKKYLSREDSLFVKLDVQGAENNILMAAEYTLPRIKGLQLETSFTPLYEGEKPFPKMLEHLVSEGFVLYDLIPGFRNPKNNQLLQTDIVLFRD